MSRRGLLLLLPAFVLLAAAINMPFAVWCAQTPRGTRGVTISNVTGPEAAVFPWPARTPHPQPWPPVHQRSVERRKPGAVEIQCWGHIEKDGGQLGFQMAVERFGWPVASIQRVRRWWPWNEPDWQMESRPHTDTGLQIRWSGTLLNPLVAGGGLWLLLIGLPWLWSALNARIRLRRGLCPACAYPFSNPDRCTECGLPRRSAAGAGVVGLPESANPAASA